MNNPARLHKKETKDSPLMNKVGDWAIAHPHLTMIILLTIIGVSLTLAFNMLYGMCTIESGIERNFMVNDL